VRYVVHAKDHLVPLVHNVDCTPSYFIIGAWRAQRRGTSICNRLRRPPHLSARGSTCTRTQTCMHACMHTHIHTHTHTLTRAHTHTLTRAHTHARTHMLTYTYTRTHTHTHAPTHTLTHPHPHPRTHAGGLVFTPLTSPFLEMVFGTSRRLRGKADIPVPVLSALNKDKTLKNQQVCGWAVRVGAVLLLSQAIGSTSISCICVLPR